MTSPFTSISTLFVELTTSTTTSFLTPMKPPLQPTLSTPTSSPSSQSPTDTESGEGNGGDISDPRLLYGTNITQLLLGLLISLENSVVLAAIFTRYHLKTSTNVLLGNICFANVVCGIMLCVVNVMDGWTQVALLKTETSLAIINCFITIATLLALITNKYVAIKSPDFKMSTGSCGRIVLIMWVVTLTLMLLKAMVYAFSEMGYKHACFRCYQVFEVVTLVIFTLSTVIGYAVTAYRAATHRKRTIHDGSRPMPADYSVEYRAVAGIGGLLLVFTVCFVFFVSMYMTWLGSGTILRGADEILITLFFLHCVICPLIICYSNRDLGANVKRIACCGRGRRPDTPRGAEINNNGLGGRQGRGVVGFEGNRPMAANGNTPYGGFQRSTSSAGSAINNQRGQNGGYQQHQGTTIHNNNGDGNQNIPPRGDGGEMTNNYFQPPPPPADPNSVPNHEYINESNLESGGGGFKTYSSNPTMDQQREPGYSATSRGPYISTNSYNRGGPGGQEPTSSAVTNVRPMTAVSLPPIDRGGRSALIQSNQHSDTQFQGTDYGSILPAEGTGGPKPPDYSELAENV